MPLDLQTRLLRVLAEREVTPLGAVEPVPVNLRLICATHRDLAKMVDAGTFREDLYYRILGARIVLPPLRLRDDLAELIEALAGEHTAGKPIAFSSDALDCMVNHAWPGNIRQLANVLRLLALTSDDGEIAMDDLPEEIRNLAPASAGDADSLPAPRVVSIPNLKQSMEEVERARILQALRDCQWRVAEAARKLGVSRATLHRRMNDYALLRPGEH